MKIERLIEQAREELITDIVLSDEFMNRMQENFLPIELADVILSLCDHGGGDQVSGIK